MAEAWRARLMGAAGVTKPVLIKKVLPEFAGDEAFISMFISEARISASLSHGNIAQIFDFGQVDGDYFLAMEYVDGKPLHHILKRAVRSGFSCLPAPVATFIALELCRGLHYAHTRTDEKGRPLGIVHRDISPDNVLVSYEGQVKIVDFGIAKARSLRSFDTAPGVVKGKYLFFSPEQARGEEVDARTDVWATGVLLFLLACGRLPLEGPEYVVMRKLVSRQELPRARDVRPDVPARLDAIIQKALALKKEDRFESAHALGDALAGFLYTSAPRFSSMSVAYLLRELFREDMTAEGRDTQVPPSFVEELSVWKAEPPLPRPTEPGVPQLDTEPHTLEHYTEEPKALAPLPRADKEPPTVSAEAIPRQGGISPSTVVGVVAVLSIAALVWLAFPWLQADWMEEQAAQTPPPPTTPKATQTSVQAPPVAPPQKGRTTEATGAPTVVMWPVDGFQLEARQHVFRVSPALAALGMLDSQSDWRLAETTLVTDADRGRSMPTLFFLLTGQDVDAHAALGTVSRKPEVIHGASGVMLFTLGLPTTKDDLPERTVTATRVKTGEVQRYTVHPEWMTASMDRALVLSGLAPEDTYRLTVEPVGEGAFMRAREHGPSPTVACVQQVDSEELPPDRALRFLLSQGEEARVTGVRGLHCGFIDDDPSDNDGAVRVRVEKSRPFAERGTAAFRVQALPRGSVAARQKVTPAAGTKAEEAPEAAPEESGPHTSLAQGQALFKAGRLAAARAEARKCVADEPLNAECHLLLGSVEARLGNVEEGAKHYRRFLELAPADHPHASKVIRVLQEYEARP
ncbi:protein kinase domain-containing protein [Pyxidicoccus parkwayensis]